METISNATTQFVDDFVDVLASQTEAKVCDLHRFALVKDLHGSALSALTFIFCLGYTVRAMSDERFSRQFRWVCQSQTVMMLFATFNHVYGLKLNDIMFCMWSVFVAAPAKLDLYERRGGAWYYSIVPRRAYQFGRLLILAAPFVTPTAPLCFFLFVNLPSQPKVATATSRLANLFLVLSLAPVFYELINDGRCPYHFPVHAITDACVFFTNIWSLINLEDVDLLGQPGKVKVCNGANGHVKRD